MEKIKCIHCGKSKHIRKGFRKTQHNFIESHTTPGKVPCELAGLKSELGRNRWIGLIKLSA